MNRFNVLITVLVCAGLCVLFGALSRSTEDATGWNPSEMYTSTLSGGSSFTNAAYSGSSNSGVALPMPSASFSSRVGAHAPYTYSASPAAGVSNQLPSGGSSAVVGHMTSSAEYHSFGGGGNAAAAGGSSMSRRSSSMNASPISYNALSVGSISLPTAPRSSSANNAGYTPSLAQEANYAITSSNMQGGLFDYALQTAYGTASYEDYYTSSINRVNNRFNAPPAADGGAGEEDDAEAAYRNWLNWLERFGHLFGQNKGDGVYDFDNKEAWEAFLVWYESVYGRPYDESNNVTPPEFTYQQWLSWFMSNGGTHSSGNQTFNFIPVGNVLPLLLMALVYMILLFVKRNKIAQS